MRRRCLLLAFTAVGGSALSGCADRVPTGVEAAETNTVRSSASNSSSSSASSASASVAASETGSVACPSIDDREVVCYRNAESNASVVLVPSTESASLAGESIGFTLRNRSDSAASFRPYGWELWRRTDRWTRVETGGDRPAIGETVLSSGGSYAWQVAVGPVTMSADRPPVTVNDAEFEPGRYAFAVRVRRDRTRVYAATFDVTE